jgi:cytochrome bd-type quinol oxidase subunit 2
MAQGAAQRESLRDQAQDVHEEARMVLPGVQALFGFQLIAAFSDRFTALEFPDPLLHFVALLLIAASMGLLMAPAAYRRLCEPSVASKEFTRLGSILIAGALLPLLVGVSLDIYVVARMTFTSASALLSIVAGVATFVALASLWFVFPLWQKRRTRARLRMLGTMPIGTRTAELRPPRTSR